MKWSTRALLALLGPLPPHRAQGRREASCAVNGVDVYIRLRTPPHHGDGHGIYSPHRRGCPGSDGDCGSRGAPEWRLRVPTGAVTRRLLAEPGKCPALDENDVGGGSASLSVPGRDFRGRGRRRHVGAAREPWREMLSSFGCPV